MDATTRRRGILNQAWIGDAVLSLYARSRILRDGGTVDSAKFERMTSNRFLAARGEPSGVEAEVGRVYEKEGIEAAFRWIEQELMPLFDRQEENRLRRAGINARSRNGAGEV
jgi:23S rRNA maturation mini-RNase III